MYYDRSKKVNFYFLFYFIKIFSKKLFLIIFKKSKTKKKKECDTIGFFRYTTWYINFSSIFLSMILFFILNNIISNFNFPFHNAVLKAGFSVNVENQNKVGNFHSKQETQAKEEIKKEWYLEIPSISLQANIEEGTNKEVMDQWIGHFEQSPKWIGNVCLAAHNRGYPNNYFSKIKDLKEGDIIKYSYKNFDREYKVQKNFIVQDNDLSCLENTEENRLTLITCVENEPNYRRCVTAIEQLERKEE